MSSGGAEGKGGKGAGKLLGEVWVLEHENFEGKIYKVSKDSP